MRILRLISGKEAARAYPCATESPRPFWADGLELSQRWFAENLGKQVEGFHLEEGGKVIGHIYWAPSERALVPYRAEPGVAWLYCEWVQWAYRGRGCMRALFSTFLEHLKAEGYKGILVGATDYEGYMHHSHFERRGFQTIKGSNGARLMFLPLGQASVKVEPLKAKVACEGIAPVEVLVIGSLFCPVGAAAVLYLRKVAAEFGDQVILKEVPAGLEALASYGVADGIFINGEPRFFGPVTLAQVRATIEKALAETGAT
ncbi:GNAT family N-acetyltransferase [Candidatus Bipolaricaulota bacterium]|nr:GNAT family N-acetyltransferase [Candidatus Bipolaricaulota bacterium]